MKKKEEERTHLEEIQSLKNKGITFEKSMVPTSIRIRMKAKENLRLRRAAQKLEAEMNKCDIPSLELDILKIYSMYPKRKTMNIEEILVELSANGYAGRLRPRRSTICSAMHQIQRRIPLLFERKLMLGKVMYKLIGCRGRLARAVVEKTFEK